MEYHVSKLGNDMNCGSEKEPFLTISKAASLIRERDTVVVHEGVYRECVNIDHGAECSQNRITFRAADGERVIIKGSEEVTAWEQYSETIYKAVVPNSIFHDYNPYTDTLWGDWFYKRETPLHTGQVYFDGASLREVWSVDEIKEFNWFAKPFDTYTEIYASFNGQSPEGHLVEINARPACVAAKRPGVNYITVSGFEMCHAATNWSPPTAGQTGLVCVNWCKGWVIENNRIYDSRCNGICLGKDKSTGHNHFSTYTKILPHYCQVESVFNALQRGWNKDMVGSHIVRNNIIYNCGQTGIVGHMGCAFSEVYGNHIYNIQNIGEFDGDEIAGIKFHAPIDTYIHHNHIHDCYRGMWLDWQVQGVRVSSNVLYNNAPAADLYFEVTHGPFMVDNNAFLSEWSMAIYAQGSAYINNIFGGTISKNEDARHTPYHFAHSTAVKGFTKIFSGDDRIYNNIFVGGNRELKDGECYGTCIYNGHTRNREEYIDCILNRKPMKLPVYANHNVYLAGAKAFDREEDYVVTDHSPDISVTEENGEYYINIDMPKEAFTLDTEIKTTDDLPITLYTDAAFENANGTPLIIDTDSLGTVRGKSPAVGPFENIKIGKNKILFWK